MNKQGSVAIVFFMVAILLFLLALALTPSLVDTTTEAGNSTELNCSNVSISNADKAVCYQLDTLPPLYIGLLAGLAGLILARVAGG
jgi:hypothetical protein